jgi:hypothetical protein
LLNAEFWILVFPAPWRFILRFRFSIASLASLAVKLLAILLLAPMLSFAQADYAREQRWADEITPAILVGDPVYLELKSG